MTHSDLEKEIRIILGSRVDWVDQREAREKMIVQLLALIDKHTKKYVEEILPHGFKISPHHLPENIPWMKGYNQALSDIREKVK